MHRFPTGVTVVTTIYDDTPKGFTANAFASVSAEPPVILVCVNRQARSHPVISQAGKFCVNVLRLEQQPIAEGFALRPREGDPFATLAYTTVKTGSPVLDGALAFFDCELLEGHTAGTHTIFIGSVLACGGTSGAPLGYFDSAYRDFGCRIT
ncbi:MAG: flavin reductase family protein [Candidatus Eremiobacteraeota bacterium]|nr:flavin reductase family protein [Candidatus Eremiobacteraeota bacterium]